MSGELPINQSTADLEEERELNGSKWIYASHWRNCLGVRSYKLTHMVKISGSRGSGKAAMKLISAAQLAR
jgi:hypothetical protein